MREIKFRVWDLLKKEWIKDFCVITYTGSVQVYNSYGAPRPPRRRVSDGEEYVTQQFTGLKDKNGKEIYEGDILKAHRSSIKTIIKDNKIDYEWQDGEVEIGQIYWGECSFIMSFEHIRYDDSADLSQNSCSRRLEVLGNIFENPDLLNENNKDK